MHITQYRACFWPLASRLRSLRCWRWGERALAGDLVRQALEEDRGLLPDHGRVGHEVVAGERPRQEADLLLALVKPGVVQDLLSQHRKAKRREPYPPSASSTIRVASQNFGYLGQQWRLGVTWNRLSSPCNGTKTMTRTDLLSHFRN